MWDIQIKLNWAESSEEEQDGWDSSVCNSKQTLWQILPLKARNNVSIWVGERQSASTSELQFSWTGVSVCIKSEERSDFWWRMCFKLTTENTFQCGDRSGTARGLCQVHFLSSNPLKKPFRGHHTWCLRLTSAIHLQAAVWCFRSFPLFRFIKNWRNREIPENRSKTQQN